MQRLSQTLSIVLVAYLMWLGWSYLGPQKPEIGPLRQQLADQVIVEVAEDLRKNGKSANKVILLHFGNDPSGYMTDGLYRILELRGVFNLADRGVLSRARGFLNLRQPVPANNAEAAELARQAGVDAALVGRINVLQSRSDGAIVDVNYTLVSAAGEVIYQNQFKKSTGSGSVAAAMPQSLEDANLKAWTGRVLGWILVVMMLPVFTIGFIREMVRRNSNQANALVLTVYTAADLIFAYFIILDRLSGNWLLGAFGGAFLVALFYNIWITLQTVRWEK